MQTCENSIIVTRIHSALICSKIQVYDIMVEYNNYFLCSVGLLHIIKHILNLW